MTTLTTRAGRWVIDLDGLYPDEQEPTIRYGLRVTHEVECPTTYKGSDPGRRVRFILRDGEHQVGELSVFQEFESHTVEVCVVMIDKWLRGDGHGKMLYESLKEWVLREPNIVYVAGAVSHPAAVRHRIDVFGVPDTLNEGQDWVERVVDGERVDELGTAVRLVNRVTG